MAKIVSQETYDQIVKENMEEFSMNPEEAIQDAVEQLEAQGVDLSNIIKDLSISNPTAISDCIVKLRELNESSSVVPDKIINELNSLKTECDIDLAHKMLAAKQGAYDILIEIINKKYNDDIIIASLKTMVSLMTGQPDLLNEKGVELIGTFIDNKQVVDIRHFALRWMRETCIKHELNRQGVFSTGNYEHLKKIIEEPQVTLIKDVCIIFRALVLDDDIRHQFGKAHEHAKIIAVDTLSTLTSYLLKYKEEVTLIGDLILTISALLVRNEFCQEFQEQSGLKAVLDILIYHREDEKITQHAFKLLAALAGNDNCKKQIIIEGAAPILTASINKHKNVVNTLTLGLSCVAALSLRQPDNSQALFEAGIPEVIVESMKIHESNIKVQKQASWAIRNMVSRSRHQNKHFLSLGVEELLVQALSKFKKECEYDLKAALRDLECNVELKEEWTGKGGKIHTSEKKTEE